MNLSSSARTLCLAAVVVSAGCADRSVLTHGRRVHGDIARTEQHVFHVAVPRRSAVRVFVDQNQADLVFTVTRTAHGVRTIDMRERGVESITLVADGDETFTLGIQPKNAAQARVPYALYLDGAPHPASDRDREQVQAEDDETFAKLPAANQAARAQSIARATDALRIWEHAGDDAGRAAVEARLGDLFYADTQYAAAIEHYGRARVFWRVQEHPIQLAVLENNVAAAYEQLGAFADANAHIDAALSIWQSRQGAQVELAIARANKGSMLMRFGDYQGALEAMHAAEPVLEQYARINPALLNNIGVLNRAAGDLDTAAAFFKRALDALPAAEPRRARVALRLAQLSLDRGDLAGASTRAGEALTAIRAAPKLDGVGEGDALLLLSEVDAAYGRLPDALRGCELALASYKASRARRSEAAAWHTMGSLLRRMSRPGAREALMRALVYRQNSGLRDEEAQTHYELGLADMQARAPLRALDEFAAATTLLEGVRAHVAGEYSRITYLAARHRYFAAHVDALMQLHAQHPGAGYAVRAFDVAERERARALIDMLRDSGRESRRGADDALVAQAREQRRSLDFWAGQLAAANLRGAAGTAAADDAQQKMLAHLAAYRDIDARIQAANGGTPASAPPTSLSEIQRRLLDEHSRLVSVSLGERKSYVWVASPSSVTVTELPARADIENAASRVAELLRARHDTSPHPELRRQFEEAAGRLSAIVVAPIAAQLGDHRLLLVTDGVLQLVPFAALPEPGTQEPLIERHEIAVFPSASAVLEVRDDVARRGPASKTLAVLADAIYEREDPRLPKNEAAVAAAGQPAFRRLILSRDEANAVRAHTAPDQQFLARSADVSRDTVLQRIGDYRVVHFGVHAFWSDPWPELSALALSAYDAQGRPRDGMLRLSDIAAHLNLKADVVVLSACNAASGRVMPGEGVMGLARGFFGAGAASVIASLNTAIEEPTLEIMTRLYDEMLGANQRRPAAALRAAQRAMRAHPRFSDPTFWSGFVFMGDPR